jgi:hypothetical protein
MRTIKRGMGERQRPLRSPPPCEMKKKKKKTKKRKKTKETKKIMKKSA